MFGLVAAFQDGGQSRELQRLNPDFRNLQTIEKSFLPEEKNLSFLLAGPSFVITKADQLIYGFPSDDYVIKVYANDGALEKLILLNDVPSRIPKKEIDYITRDVPAGISVYIPDHYSPYYRVDCDDQGNIIVLARTQYLENAYTFDIFNPDGRYLLTTTLRFGFRALKFKWTKNRLYIIGEDDNGLPCIKVYRLKFSKESSAALGPSR